MVLSNQFERVSSLAVHFTSMVIHRSDDLLLFHFSQQYEIFSPYTISVLVYGLFYLFVLFGSASVAYFNKWTGRFLLPIYIPFITLLVLTVDILIHFIHQHNSKKLRRVIAIGFAGALIVIGVGLLRITIPVGLQSHAAANNDLMAAPGMRTA